MPRERKNYDRPIEYKDPNVTINKHNLIYRGFIFLGILIVIIVLLFFLYSFKDTHGKEIFNLLSHIITLVVGGLIGGFIENKKRK